MDEKDLLRDLRYWETLCISSVMQRPHLILTPNDEVLERQTLNLKSAFAFSSLVSTPGELEQEFYENIVEIPHYESKYLSLLDREDSIKVVAQNFDKFQQLYRPIHQEYFKDIVSFEDGRFKID